MNSKSENPTDRELANETKSIEVQGKPDVGEMNAIAKALVSDTIRSIDWTVKNTTYDSLTK